MEHKNITGKLIQQKHQKCNNNSLDMLHVGHVRNATNNTDFS